MCRRNLSRVVWIVLLLAFSVQAAAGTHIVSIGISAYAHDGIADLQHGVEDAARIAALIEGATEGGTTRLLTDGEATREAIRLAFASLEQSIHPSEPVVVFLSGRSLYVADYDRDETVFGYDAAFLPVDAVPDDPFSYVLDEDLAYWVSRLPSEFVIVILDTSCVGPNGKGISVRPSEIQPDDFANDLFSEVRDTVRLGVLSAAQPGKPAYEDPEAEHGVLTRAILEAFAEGTGSVDSNGDDLVSFAELAAAVADGTESQASLDQVPFERSREGISIPFVEHVVRIPDAALELAIRTTLGLFDGVLRPADLVRLRDLEAIDAGIVNLEGLEFCTNLDSLDLEGNGISDLKPIQGLTDLLNLSLRENEIADLAPLGNLQGLRSLDISNNQVTDLQALETLSELRDLIATGNGIQDLSPLTNLPRLNTLIIATNRIEDLTPVLQMPKLGILELAENRISDISPLAGLHQLWKLGISKNPVSDLSAVSNLRSLVQFYAAFIGDCEDFTPIGNLVHLEALAISGNEVGGIEFLRHLLDLRALNLASTGLTSLEPLEGHTKLRELRISGNPIADLRPISGCVDLEELYAHESSTRSIEPLAQLTKLQTLALTGNQLSDIGALSGLSELTFLTLADNEITSIDALAETSKLEILDLGFNAIDDIGPLTSALSLREFWASETQIEDLTPLAGLTALETIVLPGAEVRSLAPLAGLLALRSFRMSENRIDSVEALRDLRELEVVDLDFNRVSDASPLEGLGKIHTLWLNSNELGDISFFSTAAFRETLVGLDLAGNHIRDIDALTGYTSLDYLWLSENELTDVSALSTMTNLREVSLYLNEIGDLLPLEGLTKLENVQARGTGITSIAPLLGAANLLELDVSGNDLEDLGSLAEASFRERVQSLDLGDTGLVETDFLEFYPALQGLWIDENRVSNISSLASLEHLEVLGISENPIEDHRPLQGLTSLTALDVSQTGLTDLRVLSELASMAYLFMDGNEVASLEALEGMTELVLLNARATGLTSLAGLEGMENLQFLSVGINQITDASILEQLPALSVLWLDGNRLTDISWIEDLTRLGGAEIQTASRMGRSGYLFHDAGGGEVFYEPTEERTICDVDLSGNEIADLSPLSRNTGLDEGDLVLIYGNPGAWTASGDPAEAVTDLHNRGVDVQIESPISPPAADPVGTEPSAASAGDNSSHPSLGEQRTLVDDFESGSRASGLAHWGWPRELLVRSPGDPEYILLDTFTETSGNSALRGRVSSFEGVDVGLCCNGSARFDASGYDALEITVWADRVLEIGFEIGTTPPDWSEYDNFFARGYTARPERTTFLLPFEAFVPKGGGEPGIPLEALQHLCEISVNVQPGEGVLYVDDIWFVRSTSP